MKHSSHNRFESFEPINCDACGIEFLRQDLLSIKLAGFTSILLVCDECKSKDAEENYKTAANLLSDIEKIVGSKTSSEERLDKIRALLNGDI